MRPAIASQGTPFRAQHLAWLNRLLVLEGDVEQRASIQVELAQEGVTTVAAETLAAATRELERGACDLFFCDLALCPPDAALWDELGNRPSRPVVVATTADASLELALAAIERGADDVVFKPVSGPRLAVALARAGRLAAIRREVGRAPAHPAADTGAGDSGFAGMVGASDAMRRVFRTVEKAAAHKTNVLILGESGTGKELVARAIHDLGPRRAERFVAINCGAIPATLLESELFGYRRGAFTDASRDKAGLFEEAGGGTLFLDEVGELPLALQVKLLRAIQEGEIRRLGDNRPTPVDVRIIAATVRDLAEEVAAGRFRQDLYYRLNVLAIELPPLRRRPEDIPPLVAHFVRAFSAKHGESGEGRTVDPEAMRRLCSFAWPGNIRQLENTIERAIVLSDEPVLGPEVFEERLRPATEPGAGAAQAGELSIKKATRRIERELIGRALAATSGNRTSASKLLEISHRALLYKIKEYGL